MADNPFAVNTARREKPKKIVAPGEGRPNPPSRKKKVESKPAPAKPAKGGLTAAQRKQLAFEAKNNTRLTAPTKPIKPASKKELQDIRANVTANAALKGLMPTLKESAKNAPSAYVSGVNILGPNLYRAVGGKNESPAIPEKANPYWVPVEAAGILPMGKILRGGGLAAKAIKAGRAGRAAKAGKAAEAAADVVKAADEPPTVLERATETVRSGVEKAKPLREQQEGMYSVERAKRAKRAQAALDLTPGVEGYKNALRELKGPLPKLGFQGFDTLDDEAYQALINHINDVPALRPFEKIRAMDAITKAISGTVPQKNEIDLLERIFGPEVAANLSDGKNISGLHKLYLAGVDAFNIPRSLMASFDLSAPFRQALVAGMRHPVIFARNFKPMVKAFGQQKVYDAVLDDIVSRPTFPLMKKAGLSITDLASGPYNMEEQFFSKTANKIPGIKNSSRAYTAFLDKMRADVFDHLIKVAHAQGLDIHDKHLLESLAKYINASTGRGDMNPHLAVALNNILFSPRLMMSRFNFLNPVFYGKMHPFARQQALRAAFQTVGAISVVLGLAAAAGAKVGRDPRNADFAKIRLGRTRIDIAGGFQQPVRLLSQLASGKVISSTSGEELRLGPQGPGKLSRRDITQRFFEAKLAPSVSLINDWAKGTNFLGQPFSWRDQAVSKMIPLLAQDSYELYKQQDGGVNGIAAALGAYGIGMWGVGFQTYGPKVEDKTVSTPGNPFEGQTSSNPFQSSGGGSSTNPFAVP